MADKSVSLTQFDVDRLVMAIEMKVKSLQRSANSNPLYKSVVEVEEKEFAKLKAKLL